MKQHTTIKAIRNNWTKVFRCGYCDLQYIMIGKEANFYNSGVYGWNCDIYCDYANDIAITTGYRNMAGQTIPGEIIQKYSEAAKKINSKCLLSPYDEIKAKLDENRNNFFAELDKL